jgi:DNA repair protein RadC
VFSALFLDNRHRLLVFEKIFYGTINESLVYPRGIIQRALKDNATAMIAAHNHPSGNLEPSMADEEIQTAKDRDGCNGYQASSLLL